MTRKWIEKARQPLLIVLAASALTFILSHFEFHTLEARLYDLRMTLGPQPSADRDIVLVTLDDRTTQSLKEISPLSLSQHAVLLEKLAAYDPKAIGYLVNMNYVSQANPLDFAQGSAKRFLKAVQKFEDRGTPVIIGTQFDINGEVVPPPPLDQVPHAVALVHQDGTIFSEDRVTRRALAQIYNKPSFHALLAGPAQGQKLKGSFPVTEVDGDFFLFRYHGDPSIDLSTFDLSELPYTTVSFIDVIHGKVHHSVLKEKTLLVGTLSRENLIDYARTPFNRQLLNTPKIVVHANILDSIKNNRAIHLIDNRLSLAITFFVILIIVTCVMAFTPLYGVAMTIGLSLVVLLIGQVLFFHGSHSTGYWLPESHPLLAIFLSYYLVVPYRLIREYKQRWEYQRRNRILAQVEELKTNFMSLVTHDLKTPVAKIQGLAEMLQKKGAFDAHTVSHIIQSTDDLNRFISAVLELNKIESKSLRIEKISRDVNQVIEKVLEPLLPLASTRNIKVVSKLEPLFPIQIDPVLISKVINNLIDNAIKYSPEGGVITVHSREVDNWIEIRVSDQGIGLSEDELKHLFTKFYRAKNDTTTQISGTGLGLYLTKFFVEAHRGQVTVESELGKGSQFIIRLPIDSTASGNSNNNKQTSQSPGLTQIFSPGFYRSKEE